MGKLEGLTQKSMQPLSLGLTSALSGGESTDWVREESGFGRQGHPGTGIHVAIQCQVYPSHRIWGIV